MCANSDGLDHDLVCHDSSPAAERETESQRARQSGQSKEIGHPAKQSRPMEKLEEHRLAPIQIWSAPVQPDTGKTGLPDCRQGPMVGAGRD